MPDNVYNGMLHTGRVFRVFMVLGSPNSMASLFSVAPNASG